jgi:hypothetical protein
MHEGSFNAERDAVDRDKLMAEALRGLRPGGEIRLPILTGDSSGNYGKLSLPGPAAAVGYAPTPSESFIFLTPDGGSDATCCNEAAPPTPTSSVKDL